MHSHLSESFLRKTSLYVGLAALAAGIGMAFEYGRAMSYLHAVSLGLLAIAVSIAFVSAEMYRAKGRKVAGIVATIAGIAFSVGEYGTHFGYTVGSRVADTQQTAVQNARYDGSQEAAKEDKSNLELWKKQLATLLDANAWAATVKADALRAQVEVAQKEIDLEAARGGCKAKCSARMKDKADLEERIGKIEQASDLAKRIEATQRILDKKREVAGKAEFKSSKIVNQATGFAQIAVWDDKPSDAALSWTQLVLGAIIAAITTYLAPFCLSVAFSGLQRRDESEIVRDSPAADAKPSTPTQLVIHREIKTDDSVKQALGRLQALIADRHGAVTA